MRAPVLLLLAVVIIAAVGCTMVERVEVFSNQHPRLYEKISTPTVKVNILLNKGGGHGSGLIVGRAGDTYFVLTCFHCVNYVDGMFYIKHPKMKRAEFAKVRAVDSSVDLAMVSFTYKGDLPLVAIAQKAPSMLDHIFLYGHAGSGPPIATDGIVSAKFGVWPDLPCAWIVTSSCWFGNSGGGCFNAAGELIGVAARIRYEGYQYLPWQCGIVPLNEIKKFLSRTELKCVVNRTSVMHK